MINLCYFAIKLNENTIIVLYCVQCNINMNAIRTYQFVHATYHLLRGRIFVMYNSNVHVFPTTNELYKPCSKENLNIILYSTVFATCHFSNNLRGQYFVNISYISSISFLYYIDVLLKYALFFTNFL